MTVEYSVLDAARFEARRQSEAPVQDRTIVAPMKLVSVSDDGLSAVVQDLGESLITIACNPSSVWTRVQVAMVLRDPTDGRAVYALGPASTPAEEPAPPPKPTPEVVRRSAVVTPASTGTYWGGRGWGTFNAGRGTDILYQGGSDIGVGLLRGAAFYGGRILALGASRIIAANAHLAATGYNSGSWSAVLQPTWQSNQPGGDISLVGAPSSSAISGTGTADIDVTAAVELMRKDQAGGLALVGGTYGAVWGTSRGDAMSLSIDYEVNT